MANFLRNTFVASPLALRALETRRASMGPRPCRHGKMVHSLKDSHLIFCFNGAELLRIEKHYHSVNKAQDLLCNFNIDICFWHVNLLACERQIQKHQQPTILQVPVSAKSETAKRIS
jgi:hypothetical protein